MLSGHLASGQVGLHHLASGLVSGLVRSGGLGSGQVARVHLASGTVPQAAPAAPLAANANVATTVTKVNEVLLALKNAGLMRSG